MTPPPNPLSKGRLASGAIWSMAGFAVLAASGLAFNALIGRWYGAEAVGILNQVFAVYIVLAMMSGLGVQLSALHHIAPHSTDPAACRAIVTSALIVTAALSLTICLAAWAATPLLARILDSRAVGQGFLWALPGVFFFALNKVMLNALNGLFQIRALAVFQSLRFVLAIAMLALIIRLDLPATATPGCLSGAEILLVVFLGIYLRRHIGPVALVELNGWVKRHLSFGVKGVLGGVVSEINTRVDVLMLGIFVSDRLVGIYSIAALVVEGLAKLADVLRFPINPYLSSEIAAGRLAELVRHLRWAVRTSYGAVILMVLTAAALYPLLPKIVINDPQFEDSFVPFAILAAGLAAGGGYRPLNLILSQAGHPGHQTLLHLLNAGTNLVLNLVLIPPLGINGAAAATAIVFVLNVGFIKWLFYRATGCRI